jgi:hypothetical protein
MLTKTSAIINAAATFLPSESDWDIFDKGVGDGLWRSVTMIQSTLKGILAD